MNIAVIGSGYVGLVTGVCLAEIGHKVICVDNDLGKIKKLQKGKLPIFEPQLDALLQKNLFHRRLVFSSSVGEATKKSTVLFIAVGTPSKKNGDPDLIYVENVAREIALHMDSYKLIVEKSTVPAETGNRIRRTIHLNLPNKFKKDGKCAFEFDVASSPEFLREGSAVSDFLNPDRIVIGVETTRAERILREIYEPIKVNVVVTDIKSAELIKHASNAFLATKISFINAVAQICDHVGGDVLKVAEGMGLDKRIGRKFLDAGIGYGGSCFPKDVDAFIRLSEKNGYAFSLLKEVRNINEYQKNYFIKLIEDKLWNIRSKVIGVLGLAFKPNTDDMRSAPSISIINSLQHEGAKIKVYDPQAMPKSKGLLKKVAFCKNSYDLAKGCDCLLLLTEWDEFKELNFEKIKRLMRHAIIFDGRNLYHDKNWSKLGFEYYGIGRNHI